MAAQNFLFHTKSEKLTVILKYDYMNDYMYDYMKGVTNSLWEFVSPLPRGFFALPAILKAAKTLWTRLCLTFALQSLNRGQMKQICKS